MTIRNLAHILLSIEDLDREVKVHYRSSELYDITSIGYDGVNLSLGVSGYNEDKLTVKTEIEVKSPNCKEPKIF